MAPNSQAPGHQADAPSAFETTNSPNARKFWTTKKIVLVAATVGAILVVLGLCLLMWRFCKGRQANRDAERNNVSAYTGPGEKPNYNKSSLQPSVQIEKGSFSFVICLASMLYSTFFPYKL